MEIADKFPRAACSYLTTILVEDKFPNGAALLLDVQIQSTEIDFMLKKQKLEVVKDIFAERLNKLCYYICQIGSDRYPAHIARLALAYNERGTENEKETFLAGFARIDAEQIKVAAAIESIILRLPKKTELPTPEDLSFEDGMAQIESILFSDAKKLNVDFGLTQATNWLPSKGTETNLILFNYFKKHWRSSAKSTARLFLYNLVGRLFHEFDSRPTLEKWPDFYGDRHTIPIVMKKVELDSYVFDKHTSEGKKMKRGMKHFLEEGAKVENKSSQFENRVALKRKVEEVYMEQERLTDTKKANSRYVRKKLRIQFNRLKTIKGEKVKHIQRCQIPCGTKPETNYYFTEKDNIYFVKGPYKDTSRIQFQYDIDHLEEKKVNILTMGLEIINENGLFYLCCKAKTGFTNMSPNLRYNDELLWNLTKVLIFRYVHNISDTNLRNVMYNEETHEVLSVDEMTPNRTKYDGLDLMQCLFNKPPNKWFKKLYIRWAIK